MSEMCAGLIKAAENQSKTGRVHNVDTQGFQYAMQKQELLSDGHAGESIAYIALVTPALSEVIRMLIMALRDHTGGSLGLTPERFRKDRIPCALPACPFHISNPQANEH